VLSIENEKAITELRARFDTLMPHEGEVMASVVTGRLNKQIATTSHQRGYCIGYRGQIIRNMKAAALPDLARMADKLDLAGQYRLFPGPLPQPAS